MIMLKEKIKNIFKKHFITGMVVIVPLWITILLLKAVINLIDNTFKLLPPSIHPKTYLPFFGIENGYCERTKNIFSGRIA